MLLHLAGSDSYLAHQAIAQLKQKYLAKNPTATEIKEYDADEALPNWADLQAVPLFASSRLIIIKRAGLLTVSEQANLATSLANVPSTTVVSVWDAKPLAANSPLALALARADKYLAVEPLTDSKLFSWLRVEVKNRSLSLEPSQIQTLIGQFGSDLWALSTELDTLRLNVHLTGESLWQKTVASEPFIYFRLIRAKAWEKVRQQLKADWQTGVPIELTIGGLAAAIRKESSTELKRQVTDLLIDLDVGLKTGLIDAAAATALLIAHLPKPQPIRVQWERLWEEI